MGEVAILVVWALLMFLGIVFATRLARPAPPPAAQLDIEGLPPTVRYPGVPSEFVRGIWKKVGQ